MKPTPMLVQLSIHRVFLGLKFPALLSIEVEMDQKRREILKEADLTQNPLSLDLKKEIETVLDYDAVSKQFYPKKLFLILYITTKSTPNRIRAGFAQIQLSKASEAIKEHKVKLLKSHDQSAFINISLKTRLSTSQKSKVSSKAGMGKPEALAKVRSSSSGVFKSAVYYKNNQMSQPEQKSLSNELQHYLGNSLHRSKASSRKQCKHWSSRKLKDRSDAYDESKTERRSYGYTKQLQNSEASGLEQVQLNKLNNKSDYLSREVSDAKVKLDQLMAENKGLKGKLRTVEDEIDKKEGTIKNLHRKLQVKESAYRQQIKQLKVKLKDVETQLKEQLSNKNQALGNWQGREKELMVVMKNKERAWGEERRRLEMQLQGRDCNVKELDDERKELKELLVESQEIVDHLTQDAVNYELKIDNLNDEATNYRFELSRVKQELSDLNQNMKQKSDKSDDAKILKRQMHQLQRKKEESESMLNQKKSQIQDLLIKIDHFGASCKSKQETINALLRENKVRQQKIENLSINERQLKARVHRFQSQTQEEHAHSQQVSKQVRSVQVELSKVKIQSEYHNATKAKQLTEYQKINQLLNKKMQLLTQQSIEQIQKNMTLKDKLDVKEEQYFQLARQLLEAKEDLVAFQTEIEIVKDERDGLQRRLRELDGKEEEVMRLEQELEHKEKLLDQLQQRQGLRQIELRNEIRSAQSRREDREEQLQRLRDQLGRLEQLILDNQGEIQSLKYTIKNLQTQNDCLHQQSNNYLSNNLHFQQRMLSLQRSETSSLTNIQQLHQQNLNYMLMLKQNQNAMTALGKRYDNLFKSVVMALERFYELLTQSKNIANQHIKHDKVEISSLFNDCLRKVGEQRGQQAESINQLEMELMDQRAKNSQSNKVIKIKSQMQEQLEQEVHNFKNHIGLLQTQIATQQQKILDYQTEVKDKMGQIRELKLQAQNTRKDYKNELDKKQDLINGHLRQIEKLNQQICANLQKSKKIEDELKRKMEGQQLEAQNKMESANQKYIELEGVLKVQKQALRLLKLRSAEQENTIGRQAKQKEEIVAEIQKRTKDIISVRAESEYRYRLVCQKQNEISQMKKITDKLQKERDALEAKRKGLEEGNKSLLIARGELEGFVKDKNNEILTLRGQISELQVAKTKLTKVKEDLAYSKKSQEQTIRELNQNLKLLKDSLLSSEQHKSQFQQEKQVLQKEHAKKVNVMAKENQNLQKQLDGLKLKTKELSTEQREKSAELVVELNQARKKNHAYEEEVKTLKKEIMNFGSKGYRSPAKNEIDAGKEKDLVKLVSDLTTLTKTVQRNQRKLPQMMRNNSMQKQNQNLSVIVKELISAINHMKIVILNRGMLGNQIKMSLLQQVKEVQAVADRLSKQCVN